MKASDIMTHATVTTSPDASLEEAVKLMLSARVSGLPVVDAVGTVVGIITEGDLLRRAELGTEGRKPGWLSLFLSPGRAAQDYVHSHGKKVKEVMSGKVITISPEATLNQIVGLMETMQVKRLPVLDNDRLIGIISRADLLRALMQLLPPRQVPAISDVELRHTILAAIRQQPWAPCANIDATVDNGIVELRGAVTDDRERTGLRVLVENLPGVRGVHDRLIWIDPGSCSVIELPRE